MASLEGRILVTGAVGQIGSELTRTLRDAYGPSNVVAAGHIKEPSETLREGGPFTTCDVRNPAEVRDVVDRFDVQVVYHMAAVLSASGERDPQRAWDVNVNGLFNVFEAARDLGVQQVFAPSSMAVFGPDVPHACARQDAPLHPTTLYGIAKVAGEAMGDLYFRKFGLDVRGLRYPGIISHETLPGGGTTDYAVEIFYAAEACGHYQCFVAEDTVLPMMYMDDCIRATLELMEAPREQLSCATGYNVAGASFSVADLVSEIKRHLPGFHCSYAPDERQQIADSWPQRLDDEIASQDWGWSAEYGLGRIVSSMVSAVCGRNFEQQHGVPAAVGMAIPFADEVPALLH